MRGKNGQAFRENLGKAAALTGLDGLLLGVFLLLLYGWLSADREGAARQVLLLLACAAYLFCLIPFRFYEGELLRYWRKGAAAARKPRDYFCCLRAGLFRYLIGLLWGLPFLAALSLFLYGMEYLQYNRLGMIFEGFAAAVGLAPSLATGLLVCAGLMALLLLLFFIGWRRDGSMPYLPCRRLSCGEMLRASARVRKAGFHPLLANSLWNFLLLLPALTGAAFVLTPYAAGHLRTGGDVLMTVQGALRLIKTPLPGSVIGGLALDAVFLYLPLRTLRRMRTAALVRGLTPEMDETGIKADAS